MGDPALSMIGYDKYTRFTLTHLVIVFVLFVTFVGPGLPSVARSSPWSEAVAAASQAPVSLAAQRRRSYS